jgi:DNA-binding Lrp family transcriptional regulator
MDELDLKIFRALISERAIAPSRTQVTSSLRSIAARVGADDTTVSYRYKRLQESGSLSDWQLLINPTFFGRRLLDVMLDVQPESAKPDMIRKLKLIGEVTGLLDFYGRALKLVVMYSSEETRSRTIELISRITNPESMTQTRWTLPTCKTERLTEADVAIIRALSHDARKSLSQVAKQVGLSTRTVRNRVGRLRMDYTVFALPALDMGGIPGLIPVVLSYSYAGSGVKSAVDRAMLTHFSANYISVEFADPENAYLMLSASTMTDVREYQEWAESQPGVASVRTDILTRVMMFPEKLTELLERRADEATVLNKTHL